MADTRFILIGIALVFAGFIILGVFGDQYQSAAIESDEFDTCYEYGTQQEPVPVSCSDKMIEMVGFLGVVIATIGAGAAALVRGARGDWDSRIRPEDMVGPGGGDVAGGLPADKDDNNDNPSQNAGR